MAQKDRGLGPVKRFGVRYGRTTKHRRAAVEFEQKAKHKCPYCSKPQLKRIAAGIYACQKCRNTFTGKAYVPMEKARPAAVAAEETVQEPAGETEEEAEA